MSQFESPLSTIPGVRRPLASIEPGNQPRRAGAVGIVFIAELGAQQRLFRAYAREERWDQEDREQHPDARTKIRESAPAS